MKNKTIKEETTEVVEVFYTKLDTAMSYVMLLFGFLYWNLLLFYKLGAGVTIFAFVVFLVTTIYFDKSGYKQNKNSLICLLVAALSATQFLLFDNQVISSLNFLFLVVLYIYWVCLTTNHRLDDKLSLYIIADIIKQGIYIPLANYFRCYFGLKNFSKYSKISEILAAVIGIIIFLPLIFIVVFLLTMADSAFETFILDLSRNFDATNLVTYFWQFLIGIPVAFYIFGLVYGNIKARNTEKFTVENVDKVAKFVKIAPKPTIYGILSVFNIIYFTFFVVQAKYLFSAFNSNLPEVFTYAQYARQGFFELCAVAGINLFILAFSYSIIKNNDNTQPKVLKMETLAISLFTILLIITALSKMIMYIDTYGLTLLRVYTSWFMLLLLLIFISICIRQFKVFNYIKVIIIGFVVMFTLLTYVNVDGQIAKYNINSYVNGKHKTLDIKVINELSDAAIPYFYEYYLSGFDKTNDDKLLHSIKKSKTHNSTDFRTFNFQKYKADKIREALK